MIRPCFLIVDRETSGSISTRKLVIETAKFNVITAYSSKEAVTTLEKFPEIDLVVTDSGMFDMDCDVMITALKAVKPSIQVVVINTPRGSSCKLADYTLDTFDPKELLALLQRLQPVASAEIVRRNQDLEDTYFKS